MKQLKNPSKLPGLTLWYDASDISTINNGRVANLDNVFSFRDKMNGVELTNPYGVLGPSYSFSAVNGNNAISIPYYPQTDSGQKALWKSNISQLQGLTFSMFCVYKPTTVTQQNNLGNQKYVVAIYSASRISTGVPGGFANRAIYLGDESGGTPAQRNNPSGRYIEADSTAAPPWNGYVTYGEHHTSRSGVAPTSLDKTCMTGVRIQPNLKKMSFVFDDYEFVDDFMSSKITTRGIKSTGLVHDVGNAATLIIGGPWIGGQLKDQKLYPIEGFFCEFLYFNRYLSDGENHLVSRYLKKKWIN
jgi:hypothetical protein